MVQAVLTVMEEEKVLQNVKDVGDYLRRQLEQLAAKHPIIGNVRGRGLFLGVELVKSRETLEPATTEALMIAEKMKDEGILIGASGRFSNVLKIRPPLVFSKENADFLVQKMDKLLIEVCE